MNKPHPDKADVAHPNGQRDTRSVEPNYSEDPTQTASNSQPGHRHRPEIWGHLHILGELGAGAYGRVYRAWDETLTREVALKIIRTECSDPVTAASVLREGQMLARVRHRNVVTVYGAQQIGSEFGFWMELIHGRPLAAMVRDDGPMGAEEAAVIGMSLCDALAAVHSAGLLHRDVKAQNIMRESGGRIVLMDFGAGRELVIGEPHRSDIAGTPVYMSPNVLAGGPWSARSDMYSVGVLLFFLVTGRYPLEGRTITEIALGHALGQQRMLPDLRPGLPDAFLRVVQRALESRYQTAGAMMRDLADSTPAGMVTVVRESELAAAAPAVRSERANTEASGPPARISVQTWRIGAAAASLGAVIWLLGFITSRVFNQTLERGALAQDSVIDWFKFGVASLIGPAIYSVAALLLYHIIGLAWRILQQLVPPLRVIAWAIAGGRGRIVHAAGLDMPATQAQWLLAGQVAVLVGVCWLFLDFLGAVTTFISTASAETLAELSPQNDAQLGYRVMLSIVAFVSGLCWFSLVRAMTAGAFIDRPVAAAGLAILAITVALLCAPYRLVHGSDFQRADFNGQRCYITGQSADQLLLFCPETLPRNHIIGIRDPALVRTSTIENIFSSAPAAR